MLHDNILTKRTLYLSVTALTAIGVLSGCMYCVPLIIALLFLPPGGVEMIFAYPGAVPGRGSSQ